ncbi:MAG: hypothetical protein JXR63_01620 [Spirochaetales bacterium]|nr:hypothetical protein [Spirochaetales bacterium]
MKRLICLFSIVLYFCSCSFISNEDVVPNSKSLGSQILPEKKVEKPSIYMLTNFEAAAVGSGVVELSWNKPNTVYMTAVFRKKSTDPLFSLIKTGLSGSYIAFSDFGLEPFSNYVYYVSALDKLGREVYRSESIAVKTKPSFERMSIRGTRESEIKISWDWDSSVLGDIKDVKIFRSKVGVVFPEEPDFTYLKDFDENFEWEGNTLTFTDSIELISEDWNKRDYQFYYRLIVEFDGGFTNPVVMSGCTLNPNAPAPVQDLSASYGDYSDKILLEWSVPDDVTVSGYKVFAQQGNSWTLLEPIIEDKNVANFELKYEDQPWLSIDNEYNFRVIAYSEETGDGEDAYVLGRFMPRPTSVYATNRGYLDRIDVKIFTKPIDGFVPEYYEIFRSNSTSFDESAVKIAEVEYNAEAQLTTYADSDVEEGVGYYYHVFIKNSGSVSKFPTSSSASGVAGALPAVPLSDIQVTRGDRLDGIEIVVANSVYDFAGIKVYRQRPSFSPEFYQADASSKTKTSAPTSFPALLDLVVDPNWGYHEAWHVACSNSSERNRYFDSHNNKVCFIDIHNDLGIVPPGEVKYKIALLNSDGVEGAQSSLFSGYRMITHEEFAFQVLLTVMKSHFRLNNMHGVFEAMENERQLGLEGEVNYVFDGLDNIQTRYSNYREFFLFLNDFPGNPQRVAVSMQKNGTLTGKNRTNGIYEGELEFCLILKSAKKTNDPASCYNVTLYGSTKTIPAHFDAAFFGL